MADPRKFVNGRGLAALWLFLLVASAGAVRLWHDRMNSAPASVASLESERIMNAMRLRSFAPFRRCGAMAVKYGGDQIHAEVLIDLRREGENWRPSRVTWQRETPLLPASARDCLARALLEAPPFSIEPGPARNPTLLKLCFSRREG